MKWKFFCWWRVLMCLVIIEYLLQLKVVIFVFGIPWFLQNLSQGYYRIYVHHFSITDSWLHLPSYMSRPE